MSSCHVYFTFAAGLSKPLKCPKGTLDSIMAHVAWIESELSLETEQYLDNPPHWTNQSTDFEQVEDDGKLCAAVERHNSWVRSLYRQMGEWYDKPVEGGDTITAEDATKFWHGLQLLSVEPERWSADYYRERMECLYEVMRGRQCEGISFGVKPLTEKQADSVICLFSEFLDRHDIRLAVPNGRDCLKASCDGGYTWCEKCGAVDENDYGSCTKRKCPLKAECPEDFE